MTKVVLTIVLFLSLFLPVGAALANPVFDFAQFRDPATITVYLSDDAFLYGANEVGFAYLADDTVYYPIAWDSYDDGQLYLFFYESAVPEGGILFYDPSILGVNNPAITDQGYVLDGAELTAFPQPLNRSASLPDPSYGSVGIGLAAVLTRRRVK